MPVTDREVALSYMLECPADLGRRLGYTLLRDDLHGEWMHTMLLTDDDMTLQAHRGSYKTTCLCIVLAEILVIWPEKTVMFLRKTDADVVEVIRQVSRILADPTFAALAEVIHGKPVAISRGSSTEITTNVYASPRGAVQLLGIGLGGSLTGKHADIIVTDDIINTKDRTSAAGRENTKRIYQELQNVRNPGGRIINTGTPWHQEDAFVLMPPPVKFDCHTTGLLSKEKIEQLRQSMEPSLFAANYELQHIASGNALFATNPPRTADESLLYDGVAHIDAAYGGEDFTAFTCARRDGDTIYLYGRMWQKHIETVMDAILADCDRLRCQPIHVENNADKGYLFRELRNRGYTARAYHEHMNKHYKISTFLRKWWGNIVVLDGTDPAYLAQIMDYNEEAAHDDAPDSAACVCRILDRRE